MSFDEREEQQLLEWWRIILCDPLFSQIKKVLFISLELGVTIGEGVGRCWELRWLYFSVSKDNAHSGQCSLCGNDSRSVFTTRAK